MKNIIESIRKQYPVSDLTIKELESYLTPCSFPKKYQLIKEGIYCKYAYFIEKGILRAYWVVDGEEYTTSFGVHIPEHTRSLSGSLLGYKTIP